jgi:hypothetical protein
MNLDKYPGKAVDIAEVRGYRAGISDCVAAVEHLHDHEASDDAQRDALWRALTALRALQEKP